MTSKTTNNEFESSIFQFDWYKFTNSTQMDFDREFKSTLQGILIIYANGLIIGTQVNTVKRVIDRLKNNNQYQGNLT